MSASPIDDASLTDADLAAMVAGGDRTAVMALARRYIEPVYALIARAVLDDVEVTRLTRASIVDSLVDILVAPASYWRGLTGLDDLDGPMRVRVAFFRSSIDCLSSIPWPEADAPLTLSASDGPAQPGISGVEIIATAIKALSWEDRLLLDLSLREGLSESGLSRAIGLPRGQTRRRLEQARASLIQAAAMVSDGDALQIADWESLYARVPSPVMSEDVWRMVHRDLALRWPANDAGSPDDSRDWAPAVVEHAHEEALVEQIAPPVPEAAVDPPVLELDTGPYQAEVITTRFRTFQGLRAAAEGPVDRMRSRWGSGARRADPSEGTDSRPTVRPHQPLLRDNSPEPIAGSAANRALNDSASDATGPPASGQIPTSNPSGDSLPGPVYRTRAADELLHRTQGAVISFDGPADSPARQTQMHVNSEALAPYSRPIRLRTAPVGWIRWAILIALLLLLAFVVAHGTGVLSLPGFSLPFFGGATDLAPPATPISAIPTTGSSQAARTATDEKLTGMKDAPAVAGPQVEDGFATTTLEQSTSPFSPVVANATVKSIATVPPTGVPPTTNTSIPPSNTAVPPTVTPQAPTNTAVPPTMTAIPPVFIPPPPPPRVIAAPPPVVQAPAFQPPPPTATSLPPTATPLPPIPTPTQEPATPTNVPPIPTVIVQAPPAAPSTADQGDIVPPTRTPVRLIGITATPRFPPPR